MNPQIMSEKYRASAQCRLSPSFETENEKWTITNLRNKNAYSVNFEIAQVLLSLMNASLSVMQLRAIHSKMDHLRFAEIFEFLLEKAFITRSATQDEDEVFTMLAQNFLESDAEYWMASFEAKFMDYSIGGEGYRKQGQMMHDFAMVEPDLNRLKCYEKYFKVISLPEFKRSHPQVNIKDANILHALSLANSQVGHRIPEWDGAPLIRRTSPSGGSRHPTECYVYFSDSSIVPLGLYHLQMSPSHLVKLDSDDNLYFQELSRTHGFSVLVMFTSIFSRNMYRYREPRTLRSVMIDVGHLVATNVTLLNSLGFKVKITHDFQREVEENLNIDGISESFITMLGVQK